MLDAWLHVEGKANWVYATLICFEASSAWVGRFPQASAACKSSLLPGATSICAPIFQPPKNLRSILNSESYPNLELTGHL